MRATKKLASRLRARRCAASGWFAVGVNSGARSGHSRKVDCLGCGEIFDEKNVHVAKICAVETSHCSLQVAITISPFHRRDNDSLDGGRLLEAATSQQQGVQRGLRKRRVYSRLIMSESGFARRCSTAYRNPLAVSLNPRRGSWGRCTRSEIGDTSVMHSKSQLNSISKYESLRFLIR